MQSQVRTNRSARGVGTVVALFLVVMSSAAWWSLAAPTGPDRSAGVASASSTAPSASPPSSAPPTAASPYAAASLPIGVVPTRAEADIREIATSHLNRMAESAHKMGLEQAADALNIQSIAATTWSEVGVHESRAAGPETGSADALRVVWVVRGEGSFRVMRTPPGREPFVGESGYLLIDDETGMILGMGTP